MPGADDAGWVAPATPADPAHITSDQRLRELQRRAGRRSHPYLSWAKDQSTAAADGVGWGRRRRRVSSAANGAPLQSLALGADGSPGRYGGRRMGRRWPGSIGVYRGPTPPSTCRRRGRPARPLPSRPGRPEDSGRWRRFDGDAATRSGCTARPRPPSSSRRSRRRVRAPAVAPRGAATSCPWWATGTATAATARRLPAGDAALSRLARRRPAPRPDDSAPRRPELPAAGGGTATA